jgi:ubiquinone/menaquinone biosynthesis C-methylase UbiE
MSDENLREELQRLKGLLAFANPYVNNGPIRAPVGTPAALYPSAKVSTQAIQTYPDLESRVKRDTAAIPAPENRENYLPEDHFGYWLMGLDDYTTTKKFAVTNGVTGGRYFDFGGSTGRVFRHFLFQDSVWDVWTSDFNSASVEWNMRHMPNSLKCCLNNYYPTLPIESNYFDLITAFSVFTHLDETEIGWLLELRRMLKPNGIIIVTIANQFTWERRRGNVLRTVEQFRPDLVTTDVLPSGKHVITFRTDSPYRCTVFMTDDYIRSVWGRYLSVRDIVSGAHSNQAVVVLAKA